MEDQVGIVELDKNSARDKEFFIETFGLDAFKQKWARAGNRLLFFKDCLSEGQIDEIKSKPKPHSILERPAKPLTGGDAKRQFLKMEDGTTVTWIRHPSALPEVCRPYWRDHTHLFVLENEQMDFTAYTSIFSYGSLEGADRKYRIFGPGGIRWIDYPDHEAAICDALDMSLAVAMKIEVVKTPCAGNKIAVIGDYSKRGPALASIFKAYERMGLVMTSADLGLTVEEDLKRNALPVAPRCLIPLGVYEKGVPTSIVAADGSFAGVQAMAEVLGQPLSELSVSVQGIGEVGERASEYDLPPQVISDSILFSSTKRRRIMTREKADYIVGKLADAFAQDDAAFEEDTVNYWTKNGLFKGAGCFEKKV